jgi:BolA protein
VSAPDRLSRIRVALETAFSPVDLEIEDQSAQHHGHEGAKSGKGHFRVAIVAAAFRDRNPVQRHRMVYAALAELLETDIHALSIDARPPAEHAT